MKHLGEYLHQNLNIQDKVNNIFRRMATGIKTLYAKRDIIPSATISFLLNVLVFNHVHYSSILITGISENLIIDLEQVVELGKKNLFQYF